MKKLIIARSPLSVWALHRVRPVFFFYATAVLLGPSGRAVGVYAPPVYFGTAIGVISSPPRCKPRAAAVWSVRDALPGRMLPSFGPPRRQWMNATDRDRERLAQYPLQASKTS